MSFEDLLAGVLAVDTTAFAVALEASHPGIGTHRLHHRSDPAGGQPDISQARARLEVDPEIFDPALEASTGSPVYLAGLFH